MVTASEALTRLKEGNLRFASGEPNTDTNATHNKRANLVKEQAPFAIILGCSDSRVPAEIIFDQGLGDLFVIRIAGNIVAPSQIGSVEFAVDNFGTPLVIVLGHSQCGAVKATIEALEQPTAQHTSNILSIIDRIRPIVEPLFTKELRLDQDQLLTASIHANILAATNHLTRDSQILENLVQQDKLRIVGAEYSLESGLVEFFE